MQTINLKPGKLYRIKKTRNITLYPTTKFRSEDPTILVKKNSILMFVKYGGGMKVLDFTQPTGIFLTEDGRKIESCGLVVYSTAFLEEA